MPNRLLLVEWDAADWRLLHPLIDFGEMPALARIVETGTSGRLLGTYPAVPAVQLTSLLTGKRAWQHRVCHSLELPPGQDKPSPITAARRSVAPVWDMLARNGKKSLLLGWPATHGQNTPLVTTVSDRYSEPTAGPGIRPWPPAVSGTYSPGQIAGRLDPLRVSPEDIQGDIISRYIPEWRKIDQKRDRRIGQLRLFLASDFSNQKAAADLLACQDWDFAAVRFPALAAISQIFLPFNPPRQNGISQEEFNLYQGVLRGACRMLDQMLQQLLAMAGPQTALVIVSTHGVQASGALAGHSRAPDAWKSPYGIFAACGRGFSKDSLVHGAGTLDVTPTLLTWFGLPIGDDMEGRVLIESFESIPQVPRIPTWEPDSSPSNNADAEIPENAVSTRLRQDSEWNFAQSCLEASRFPEAQQVLERLFREFPERAEIGHALLRCQMALGLLTEAGETLEVVLEGVPAGVASLVPRAELAWEKKDIRQTRQLVDEALKLNSPNPAALRRIGLLLLKLRDWNALEELASKALAMEENEPLAWLGLAAAQLRKGKAAEASEAASRAIGLQYFLPDAHFILARALVAQGKWSEAREAMQTLLQIQPNNRSASTYLKRMPQKSGKNP